VSGIELLGISADGVASIWLKEPMQCGCGRAVMLVVNRDGKTRCVVCDTHYREQRANREEGTK
jgi:hypothetical protein